MLLGVLGILSGLLATRVVDAAISMLFLGSAVVIEMMDLARQEGVEGKDTVEVVTLQRPGTPPISPKIIANRRVEETARANGAC